MTEWDRHSVSKLEQTLPSESSLRAAIQKLSDDQIGVVESFVDGFETRRDFLGWCQKVTIQTLGEISGEWLAQRCFSPGEMHVLLSSSRRHAWLSDDQEATPAETAAALRRGLVSVEILPACSEALRELRWSAVEYVADDDDTLQPEPEDQTHPAMRPALSELSTRQSWALTQLLDGFESHDALTTWGHRLAEASYAEVPDDLIQRLTVGEKQTREMLVVGRGDVEHGLRFRESVAAKFLLPAFSRAASMVAERSGELAQDEKRETTTKML